MTNTAAFNSCPQMNAPLPVEARPSVSATRIRVLLVDDSRDITGALRMCIEHEPDMESVGCLDNANDLAAEVQERRPDVVILDMKMPGKDPLEAMRGVKSTRVIVFSGRDDQNALDSACDAGASGFLSKDCEVPVILGAIREVARGAVQFGVWR